jgi:hypothetical protein
MKILRTIHHHENGAALMMALLFAIVLSAVGGVSYRILQNSYRRVHQTASWKDALLRNSLVDPSTTWQGWTDANGNTSADPTVGEISATSTILLRDTEGGDRSWVDVSVDAPAFLIDSSGEQWYRVRALGTAEVPGGSVAVGTSEDLNLRKFDLVTDRRTGAAVTHPQATRLIEAIVKPIGAFRLALMGVDTIDVNNNNIVVDSYDSRDPNKSTDGWYDPSKRQENGDIATNGDLIEAGDAHIYGDASTDGGTVLNADNVTGEIRDDFYQDVLEVVAPSEQQAPTELSSPTSVTGTTTLAASTSGFGSTYRLSTINLSGTETLTITGDPSGAETFVQIIVSGDISLSGQAQIIFEDNVYARVFIEGDADIAGNGILNPNSPLHFQLYGVAREDNLDGSPAAPGTINIAGNGAFRGAVYAPNYNLNMVGGGAGDTVYGAFLGKTINMTGVQSVHYDEALYDSGLITDYRVISWFEDVR